MKSEYSVNPLGHPDMTNMKRTDTQLIARSITAKKTPSTCAINRKNVKYNFCWFSFYDTVFA